MNLKIEAPGHKDQENLKNYYKMVLEKEIGNLKFVNSTRLKIVTDASEGVKLAIECKTENGADLYASAVSDNEKSAYLETMQKLKKQIGKYRTKHYKH